MNETDLLWFAVAVLFGVLFWKQARRIRAVETQLAMMLEERRQQRVAEAEAKAAARLQSERGLRRQDEANIAAGPEPGPVRAATPTRPPMPERMVLPPPLPVAARVGTHWPEPARPLPSVAPAAAPSPAPAPTPRINWEQFLGVKLFAWLGGFALFLATAFFLKYSFERNIIPASVRVAIGYVVAVGLIGGALRPWRRRHETLSMTLVGTGVVILYAVTFACRALYHFPHFGTIPTFLLMVLVTIAAFLLAVRMNAQVIAILGMLGGFLTPVLVNSGIDSPIGLFGYITILDLGLFAVVWHRRWNPLALLASIATVAVQIGWLAKFYEPDKLGVLQVVQPLFAALFAAFFVAGERRGTGDRWITAAMVVPVAFALLHGLPLATTGAGHHPVRLFTLWLSVDAVALAALLWAGRPRWIEPAGGALVFLLLATWTSIHSSAETLAPSLAAYFAFAVLHTALPVVRQRLRPDEKPGWAAQLFPAAALALFVLPVLRDNASLPAIFWIGVLGIDLIALMLAAFAGAFLAAGAVLAVSLVVVAAAFLRDGPIAMDWNDSLVVVAGFASLFVAGGWWLSRRKGSVGLGLPMPTGFPGVLENPRLAIGGSGAVLPFLLLTILASRAAESNVHSLFGMTALLVVLVLGLARATGTHALAAFGLAGTVLVEAAWHARGFGASGTPSEIGWQLAFLAAFTAFPFLADRGLPRSRAAWITAACAGVAQGLLVYLTARQTGPMSLPGLIPAAFALPTLGILAWLAKRWPSEDPKRLGVLSFQGGVALLFVTLVFPIQFDRQWLTLAWALEGAALLWLFLRLPHQGLRLTGVTLLGVAFARLAFNPAVLGYQARTGTPVWNWYLYAYLVAAASQFAGARLLRPPHQTLMETDVRGVLRAFGAILLFVLMNLEIADFFADGTTLAFDFTGNFARDLSYTIGWALFSLALLVAGIARSSRPTRYSGIGLLVVTLSKLFLHDLARLDQLYRIGAFAGVAVIAIAASFLYQRFLNRPESPHENAAS